MAEDGFIFGLEFTVRDYECDLQGVVNNANYQHYLEHARHQYLISKGISFAQLHDDGIDLIVSRVEIDYKFPLTSRDRFEVRLRVEREGNVRIIFVQEIRRIPDGKLIVQGRVTGVATKNRRPVSPAAILEKLDFEIH
jgi:acyl-CoA thioester hydrolase